MPREEVWVVVEDYPNYVISNRGVVMSKRSGRRLTPTRTRDGHLRVTLADRGRVRQFYMRTLVARAFHPDWREGAIVKNQNGDLDDNSIGNIYVRTDNGRPIRYRRQEPWGRPIRILETGQVFRSARDCAKYIGGNHSNIYRCLRGERSKHLGYSFAYLEEHEIE